MFLHDDCFFHTTENEQSKLATRLFGIFRLHKLKDISTPSKKSSLHSGCKNEARFESAICNFK